MEKHECKLCFKNFSNGRALGGHMSFHMTTHLKNQQPHEFGDEIDFVSSSSFSSEEEEEEKGLYYVLRENPKKSFRIVDPQFSAVQDRESETESSRIPSRRRTKRNRNRKTGIEEIQQPEDKKLKSSKPSKTESSAELEPVSSVSDTTPEEDVALFLMMLSRDIWMREEEEEIKSTEVDELKFCETRTRAKYQCGTCKKVFRSYQALGGHRASHKKIKGCNPCNSSAARTHEAESKPGNAVVDRRIHECPVCFRVFKSGQALGGHKRSHLSGSTTGANLTKFGDNLIDLNLPAPVDEDDMSQIELSAVSDAEFVYPIK